MSRSAFAVAISLLAGLAAGAWLAGTSLQPGLDVGTSPTGTAGVDDGIDERLARLEQTLAMERDARIALEDTLAILFEDIERLEGSERSAMVRRQAEAAETPARNAAERRSSTDEADRIRKYQERRVARLIEGGFSEDEAKRILQQESEAAFQVMQASWEAQRSGESVDYYATANNPQAVLRAEMGDDAYARYLEAQGQPTTINITQVLNGSPGSNAGLQPGDRLVSYNGERVFAVTELRNLTMQGQPGEDVVIEVDRDGMRMQLTVPRGPIGITGSGANVRGMRWWGG
jgi:hypothetical protein